MLIKNSKDLEKLIEILQSRLDAGLSTDIHTADVAGPSERQIKCLNAIIRDLSNQSISRGFGHKIEPGAFKELIYDMFIGPYAETLPDGTIRWNKPSAKHGMDVQQMNAVLAQIIYVFNNDYNFDLSIKKTDKGLKVA